MLDTSAGITFLELLCSSSSPAGDAQFCYFPHKRLQSVLFYNCFRWQLRWLRHFPDVSVAGLGTFMVLYHQSLCLQLVDNLRHRLITAGVKWHTRYAMFVLLWIKIGDFFVAYCKCLNTVSLSYNDELLSLRLIGLCLFWFMISYCG